MADTLQVVEGPKKQTSNESIAYTIDSANYPGTGDPTSVSATAFDLSNDTNVTSTVFPTGSITVDTGVITLKPLKLLTAGRNYNIRVLFTLSGNILETYFVIKCPF